MTDFTIAFKIQSSSQDVPQDIYHLAQAFYLAGNRAALNIEVGPNLVQSLLSPCVVNYCFSLELFFKALIQKNGYKAPKTHELEKLFNLLPSDEQTVIKEHFEAIIQQPEFIMFLVEISNYFQKVRYEYEYPIEIYYEGPIAQFAKIVYVYAASIFANVNQIPNVTD